MSKVQSPTVTTVFINVETRPQYGTTEKIFIGVFDDDSMMNLAIKNATNKNRKYRHWVESLNCELNKELSK